MDVNLTTGTGLNPRQRNCTGPVVVIVSTLDEAAIGNVDRASGARGFVPKSELASPRLVELLGPP